MRGNQLALFKKKTVDAIISPGLDFFFYRKSKTKKKNTAAHLIEGICLEGILMV